MIFTESVEFRNSVYITRIAYSGEIINACAYNVYQALCESLGQGYKPLKDMSIKYKILTSLATVIHACSPMQRVMVTIVQ